MIYEFSHYPTDDGRRVRFVLGRQELERVKRAGYLDGESLRGLETIETASPAEILLVMTPRVARVMVDVLAMVGGDAAVAARMLADALDDMVHELRSARAVADVTRTARREYRRPIEARA